MIKRMQSRVRTALRRSALFVSVGLCMTAGTSANAQIFRCADADGHPVFSDTPCGTATEKIDVADTSGGVSPISGDGLSSQEQDILRAAAEADAQRVDQSAPSAAGQASDSYTSTAVWAQRRGY